MVADERDRGVAGFKRLRYGRSCVVGQKILFTNYCRSGTLAHGRFRSLQTRSRSGVRNSSSTGGGTHGVTCVSCVVCLKTKNETEKPKFNRVLPLLRAAQNNNNNNIIIVVRDLSGARVVFGRNPRFYPVAGGRHTFRRKPSRRVQSFISLAFVSRTRLLRRRRRVDCVYLVSFYFFFLLLSFFFFFLYNL